MPYDHHNEYYEAPVDPNSQPDPHMDSPEFDGPEGDPYNEVEYEVAETYPLMRKAETALAMGVLTKISDMLETMIRNNNKLARLICVDAGIEFDPEAGDLARFIQDEEDASKITLNILRPKDLQE